MSTIQHTLVAQENARVQLTITVPKESVSSAYKRAVEDIAQKAHIKGFRRGKVPVGVLETKFGPSLKFEAMEKIIGDAVSEVMEQVEKKPLPYSRPSLKEDTDLTLNLDRDFTFTVLYDTEPAVTPADISKFSFSEPEVTVGDEDIAKELEGIQERNAVMAEKKTPAQKGDVVTVTIAELDESGAEIEGTRREKLTATVGSNQTLYDIDDDLVGMSKDETKTVKKKFPADYKFSEFAGKTIPVSITVTAVRQKNLPAIDDELAQDVSEKYKTLDDLKKDLKEQLAERAKRIVEDMRHKSMLQYLSEKSTMEVPASALEFQLHNFWARFVQSSGGSEAGVVQSLEASGRSKQELLDAWQPEALRQVREQLVIGHLIESEKIEVSEDDLWKEVKQDCEKAGMKFEDVKEYYTKHGLLSRMLHDMTQKKLFDALALRTTIKKEKPISFSKLLERRQKEDEAAQQEV